MPCVFTVETEMAWILRLLSRDRFRRPGVRAPGLHASLLELRAWVEHPRPYEKRHHERPWRSLADDVSEVLGTVGAGLRAQAASLDALASMMGDRDLGASPEWKTRCQPALDSATSELASPSASVAAFDDLHAALLDPATAYDTVESLMLHLDAVLRFGGRSLSTVGESLAGVLSDESMSVDLARAVLAGERPAAIRMPDEPAGLSEAERLSLCRDLLQHRPPRGTQVVWVCFENAYCRFPDWILPIGGVTFIDGPALAGVFEHMTTTGELPPHLIDRIPVELVDDAAHLRWYLDVAKHNKDLKEWVWARVDLGDEPYVSTLAQARRIAASLVDLASFHDFGTQWRLMDGGVVLVDGQVRSGAMIDPPVDKSMYALGFTSETLGDLADELAPHVPAIAEPLLDLLAAARTVQANTGDSSSTALLIDVQVIELVAKMTGTAPWCEHLTSNLATTSARNALLAELIEAHRAPADVAELRELPEVRAIAELTEHVSGDRRNLMRVRYDLALQRTPALCDALPRYAPGARRLRTLNGRLSSTTSAGQWIDELVRQYGRGVDRLARCRNAIAHGGPTNVDVVASVRKFANDQAAQVTSIAIWGTVRRKSLDKAHDQPRDREARWRAALDAPGATTDVLLDTSA
jgi:hypothetical protein